MVLKRSIEDKIVVWKYEELYVLGVEGELRMGLEELRELYKNTPVEFAPVKNEYIRDFLAAFLFEPPIDVTIARALDGEASIVTYSLDKDRSKQLVGDIVNKSQFSLYYPREAFIRTIEGGMLFEILTYKLCKRIANELKESLEKVVGAVRYSNFLSYKGFSESEAIMVACKKFRLPRDRIRF
ncbi:MAG: hypothetical protein ACP5O8_01125 [Candidatus Aenigmatarchaeota archaeon]